LTANVEVLSMSVEIHAMMMTYHSNDYPESLRALWIF
jgi:hypothetical protein